MRSKRKTTEERNKEIAINCGKGWLFGHDGSKDEAEDDQPVGPVTRQTSKLLAATKQGTQPTMWERKGLALQRPGFP